MIISLMPPPAFYAAISVDATPPLDMITPPPLRHTSTSATPQVTKRVADILLPMFDSFLLRHADVIRCWRRHFHAAIVFFAICCCHD